MVEIRWTEEARYCLGYVYHYIADDNPAAATRLADGIYEKVQLLATFPQMGYIYENASGEPSTVRIILYGHYRIPYRIIDEQTVDILGIFHGSMDIDRLLQRYLS